jgi:hypothetical protein
MSHQDTAPDPTPPETDEHIRVTHNMSLMAYLKYRGLDLVRYALERRDNKDVYCFYYNDPDGLTDRLYVDFINSEWLSVDAIMKTLRDMAGKKRPSRPQRRRRNNNRGKGGRGRQAHGN